MPFSLPDFNIPVNFWPPGTTPSGGPPSASFDAQLYFLSRATFSNDFSGIFSIWFSLIVRISLVTFAALPPPYVTGIIGYNDALGTTWFLKVCMWTDCHRGFPNEYIALACQQCDATGAVPDPGR